jgi:sulfite reductase (NADPH) hemoprotein beta-component
MNGCGHHSVGHIGILGVDKHGEEWYQVTLGGSAGNDAAIGERVGRALSRSEIAGGVERLIRAYLELRSDEEETFIECYRRVGLVPFKARLYEAEGESGEPVASESEERPQRQSGQGARAGMASRGVAAA